MRRLSGSEDSELLRIGIKVMVNTGAFSCPVAFVQFNSRLDQHSKQLSKLQDGFYQASESGKGL